MKNIKNNILIFLLGMSVVIFTAYTVKDNGNATKPQLMMVEVIFNFENNKDISGIYATGNDGKTSKVQALIGYAGQENISKNAGKIHNYLKNAYAAGWELESATGGDNTMRYVFRK